MKTTSHDGFLLHKLPPKKDRIFLRDGHKCLKCGSTYLLTIDHIKPICKGGSNKSSNLQTLCRKCNSIKGVDEIDYRINKPKEEQR